MVLLGDVLELRHGPPRDALARRAAVLRGPRPGARRQRELVIVAGNHDHALVEPWLTLRAERRSRRRSALEQRSSPSEASPIAARARRVGARRRACASPTRGCGCAPTSTRRTGTTSTATSRCRRSSASSVGAMSRAARARRRETFDCVDDYEAVTAPVFAWRDAVAQRRAHRRRAQRDRDRQRLARARRQRRRRGADGARAGRIAALARACARRASCARFPLAVRRAQPRRHRPAARRRLAGELRRAGLRAMGEVAARLGLGDALRRLRPHPPRRAAARRRRARVAGRRLAGDARRAAREHRLLDLRARSSSRDTPGESPYWPGTCVLVEDDGAPARAAAARPHARRALAARRETAARGERRRRAFSARPGVKHVAMAAHAASSSSSSSPAVWRSCSSSG